MRDNTIFKNGIEALGLSLSDEQYNQFEIFYDMLIEKNKVMNLTAITEYEDVVTKHFVDSLLICKNQKIYEMLKKGCKVIDIGTGAGFPGIPLKIAFPESEFVLMDSLNKRINFLCDVICALKLQKIKAIHARCEEVARKPEYRERFDLCVSRAVAKTNSLAELCMPFVKVHGMFVPYKSGNIDEEFNEAKKAIGLLGGYSTGVEKYTVPNSDYERSFILIEKKSNTPGTYPRMGGKTMSKPL